MAFGGRSFSIWNARGERVFDSGDQIERFVARATPANHNMNGGPGAFDARSDDKGPEPEGVAVGVVNGVTYAFVGLERGNAVMVYDLRAPSSPRFVTMIPAAGADSSPEGLVFVPAAQSPTGKALLIVSYEVSGTVGIFEIDL